MYNYLHYLAVLPLAFYIFLLVRKFLRKEWIKSKKLLSFLKFTIFIPFWAAFVYFFGLFAIPEIAYLIQPADSSQKIIIENTEDIPQKFLVAGRKFNSNDWFPAYSFDFSLNKSAIVSVAPRDLVVLKYGAGTKHFDIISISKLTGMSFKSDKFKGIAFKVPTQTLKVYSHQFNRPTKLEKFEIHTQKEILLLLLSITAVFGVIYHSLSTRGKKWFMVTFYSIYGITVIVSGYLVYQLFTTLWYLLL